MFALVGVVYDRAHTRDLNKLGGLWTVMPIYGGIMMFSAMANLGLPGLAGFPAEFQVVRGAWPVFTLITALSMIGVLMTGAYILKGIQKVLHGPLNHELLHHAEITDINRIETTGAGAPAGADAGDRPVSDVADGRDQRIGGEVDRRLSAPIVLLRLKI